MSYYLLDIQKSFHVTFNIVKSRNNYLKLCLILYKIPKKTQIKKIKYVYDQDVYNN